MCMSIVNVIRRSFEPPRQRAQRLLSCLAVSPSLSLCGYHLHSEAHFDVENRHVHSVLVNSLGFYFDFVPVAGTPSNTVFCM
jgi:hypothetical protein